MIINLGRRTLVIMTCVALAGCTQQPPVRPPLLQTSNILATGELELEFDKSLLSAQTQWEQNAQPNVVTGSTVKVSLPSGLRPGKSYAWSAEVTDANNNLTRVGGQVPGPNGHPAQLRLNEVRVAGSSTAPDFVELVALTAGNVGGWTLEIWQSPKRSTHTMLVDQEIKAGDFVVIAFGTPSPKLRASWAGTKARVIWAEGTKGLSPTQGAIDLGLGSQTAAADLLVYGEASAAPLWSKALKRDPGPILDPAACTTTRSWCRATTAPPQWILVTNGGASPGGQNRLVPWTGKTATQKGSAKTRSRTSHRPSGRQVPVPPTDPSSTANSPSEGEATGGP